MVRWLVTCATEVGESPTSLFLLGSFKARLFIQNNESLELSYFCSWPPEKGCAAGRRWPQFSQSKPSLLGPYPDASSTLVPCG